MGIVSLLYPGNQASETNEYNRTSENRTAQFFSKFIFYCHSKSASHHLLFSIIWWRKGTFCSGFLVYTGTGAGMHRELILRFPSVIKTSLILVIIFTCSPSVFHF